MLGSAIGNYRIVRKLGEGGMGAVYLGEHTLLGRTAAIKVLLPMLSARQDVVQRFFNEARATTAIHDPGIVQIFDFGYDADGSAFIVMEFLEGTPLDVRLHQLSHLHPIDALRIARQLALSLAAAHAKNIVHRDLKPENVFLVPDHEVVGGERVKILDFGIAKLADDQPGKIKTHTGAIMGTPVYMSPEQCRGAGDLDHRSDIYALGCLLFHLLVGRPPFEGEGMGEILAMHLREPAPPPSSRVPGLTPEIDAVVLRCLAKQPDARFQTMTELATAIGAVLQHLAPGAAAATLVVPYVAGGTPPPSQATQPLPAPVTPTTLGSSAGAMTAFMARRSGRAIRGAVIVLLVAGASGGILAMTRSKQQPAVVPAEPLPAIVDAAMVVPQASPPDAAPPPDAGTPDAEPPPPDAAEPANQRDVPRRTPRPRPDRRPQPKDVKVPGDIDGDGIPDAR